MKMEQYEHVTEYFKNLTKNHKTTFEFLKDLEFKSNSSEYQAILGSLYYWNENQ
jgi:hypothetical protein